MCYAYQLTNICLLLTKLYGMLTASESMVNENPCHPFFLFCSFPLLCHDISALLQLFSICLPHLFVFLELVVVVVFEMIHVVVVSQGFVKDVVGRRVVVFDVPLEEEKVVVYDVFVEEGKVVVFDIPLEEEKVVASDVPLEEGKVVMTDVFVDEGKLAVSVVSLLGGEWWCLMYFCRGEEGGV